jgi:hypothetical protein
VKILENSSRRILVISPIIALFLASIVTAYYLPAHAASATPTAGVVIPLYTYPTDGSWTQVIQAKQAYPNVPFIAVINPNSGPGSSQDASYVQGINNLRAAGITVVGYVATGYAVSSYSSVSNVESQVAAYHNWYAVNGILFDEMSNQPGYESYYSTIGNYVHSLGMSLTMGNPGTSVPNSFLGTLDVLCIYESNGYPSLSFITYPGYSPSNFAVIALSVSLSTPFLTGAAPLTSWFYITDAGGSNPYDVLPTYFTTEVATLSTIDGTAVTTTSTSSTSSTSTSSSSSTTSTSSTISTTTSATSSTTTSTSSKTSTTTSSTGASSSVAVSSVSLSGAPISGLWTTWSQGSNVLATGYTPISFTGTNGGSYTVTVANYANYVFCHWQDGSTSSTRTLSLSASLSLTAYYSTTGACSAPPATFTVSVKSDYLNGAVLSGISATVVSSGSTVANGNTPLSFTATSGSSYTITVSAPQGLVFDHWSTGSTSSTITLAPTAATSLSAFFKSPVLFTINSANTAGGSVPGVTAKVTSGTTTLASGATPLSQLVMSGNTYTISVTTPQGWVFSHWQDGSTSSSRSLTPTQAMTFTAYFTKLPTTASVTINSKDLSGNTFTGMWVEVYDIKGNLVTSGYTTITFTATIGAHYTIYMSNWQNYIFSHWADGNTNPVLTIAPTQGTTLNAYYNT